MTSTRGKVASLKEGEAGGRSRGFSKGFFAPLALSLKRLSPSPSLFSIFRAKIRRF